MEHNEPQTTNSKPYVSNLKAPETHSLRSSPIPNSSQGHLPSRKLHSRFPQGCSYLNLEFITKTSATAVANHCPADTDTCSLTCADWPANATISHNRGSIYSCHDGAVWFAEIVTSRASDPGIMLLLCFWFCDFDLEPETRCCCKLCSILFLISLCNCCALTCCNFEFICCFILFKLVFRNPLLHYGLSAAALFCNRNRTGRETLSDFGRKTPRDQAFERKPFSIFNIFEFCLTNSAFCFCTSMRAA